MKKALFLVGLAGAIACGSSAGDMMDEMFDDMTDVPDVDAQESTPTAMKFVGFSSELIRGDGGLFAAQRACTGEFGAGHRICMMAEIVNTEEPPTLAPETVGIYASGLNDKPCDGWQRSRSGTTNYYVSAVTSEGGFVQEYCGNEVAVACCGPR